VSLSKSGQAIAKHDEASTDVGAYIAGGCLVVGGVFLAIVLLPEEAAAAVIAGGYAVAKVIAKVGIKVIKKIATKKSKPKITNIKKGKSYKDNAKKKGTRTKNRLPEGKGTDLGPKNGTLVKRDPQTGKIQQIREYDAKGKPMKDIDFGHDHGAGDPHVHHWEYKTPKSPNPTRMEATPINLGEAK
jgi:hypothetical protein